MNILLYTWDEMIHNDIRDTLRKMGHAVDVVRYQVQNYYVDGQLVALIEEQLRQNAYDCIISSNYLPILSKISLRKKIVYISYVADNPCLTMYSEMIFNPYNYVFHFDKEEVFKLKKLGVKNIFHMPLAVNCERVRAQVDEYIKSGRTDFQNDISFMGNLYTGNNSFDEIQNLTKYQKGFIEAVIRSQLLFMGVDILQDAITPDFMKSLLEKVDIQVDGEMVISREEVMLNMIRRKTTVIERKEIVELLAEHFDTALYSQSDSSDLPKVKAKGYIDYYKDMPAMFHQSKINLNITLRSITSGISLRALDIMGAGGFLLSNYQPELAEMFEDGKELVMYYSRQDMVDKIAYYLEHDDERKLIATNGQKKIMAEFDYCHAWQKIFDTVFR